MMADQAVRHRTYDHHDVTTAAARGWLITTCEGGGAQAVCAHRTQVAAVRDRLPPACGPILVETANRFQGLERPVMLVYHPLSGRVDASAFHLDAGRLCVALSRHRVVCFVFARAGIADLLRRYAPSGNRVLGIPTDPEFLGWRAHLTVLTALQKGGRVVPIR
jgi:hypothetical protein